MNEESQQLLPRIHKAWNTGKSKSMLMRIWALSDGYGEAGFVPPQGYDWSGIRDSSVEAHRRMIEVIERYGF